jgi:hypothetical protein
MSPAPESKKPIAMNGLLLGSSEGAQFCFMKITSPAGA